MSALKNKINTQNKNLKLNKMAEIIESGMHHQEIPNGKINGALTTGK